MLAARELLGIEPIGGLYRALGRRRRTAAWSSADAADVLPPGLVPTDLVARGALADRRRRARAGDRHRRADPRRRRPSRPARRPLSRVLPVERRVPDRESARRLQRGAAARDRGRRRRVRLGRRRHRQDAGAGRALRARGARARRRPGRRARDHLHGARRRRARRAHPGAARRGRPRRASSAGAGRRLDLDHPRRSAAASCAGTRSSGRPRPGLRGADRARRRT